MAMSNERLLVHIREIEEAAEEVLSDKQEIVDLDRKRCQNREAIRAMSHLNDEEENTWMAMGNCFFKLHTDKAKKLLEKDQVKLDNEINTLRSNLKSKVNNLRDKEGQPELKGFGLEAMSRDEMAAVRQAIHGH